MTNSSASNTVVRAILTYPDKATALVVGGGTMGADVALVLARAGCRTIVLESNPTRRDRLDSYFTTGLQQLGASDQRDRVSACATMDEVDWSAIDLVIECIPGKTRTEANPVCRTG